MQNVRAEHIGSLLRPERLRQAFRRFHKNEISQDEFRAIQDEAIREVIRLQEDVGLRVVTDGEFRRGSYWAHFVEKVEGLSVRPAIFKFRDDEGDEIEFTAPHVEGKVKRTRGISTAEFSFLKSITSQTPKITIPSPPTMHFWRGRRAVDETAYTDLTEFFADLALVYREEISALAAMGATYIQLDEVPLAMLCDPSVQARIEAEGDSAEQLFDAYIESFKQALATRPEGVMIGMHLCRGNYKGRYLSEGGYERVAERLFNEIPVDRFLLEYDTPRAGDFAPLRFVPANKTVVLGLVSSKTARLESRDSLRRRVEEASLHISLDQLAISPQCGFASTVAGNPVTVEDEINKLRLLVRVAEEIWG